MTLGKDWCYFNSPNPTGWLLSEKLDGVRAFFDGSDFWTRAGIRITVPDWFKAGLPVVQLDGEIWAGRGEFIAARNAVNFGRFTDKISFRIFDVPQAAGTWAERMAFAPTTSHAAPVSFRPALSKADVVKAFHAVKREGGEGLMLREPYAVGYRTGRTDLLLKVK